MYTSMTEHLSRLPAFFASYMGLFGGFTGQRLEKWPEGGSDRLFFNEVVWGQDTRIYLPSVAATCPESEQIHCRTSDSCTRIRYICDGDNDCGDNSDEESGICGVWRNEHCERGSVRCRRMGDTNCVTISRYCELSDPPCEGDLDMRLCQMVREEKLQPLEEIVLPSEQAVVRQSSVEEVEAFGEEFL
ncbi:low-density lipoprotein receptor-related protein 1B-like [Penaeus chinensis]|uniref:low-density lipoprotein receptor-related protein 1B-like n=1 Tax=Penaeus chinensis TaxID=139456 RepID=UPI001FB850FB|nr:low-density lipoprotein receptor-related protein 1B-like [Penaeus chinensis]